MDGIRWAGELGVVGRWKGPITPGMAKSKANPKQMCRLPTPFLTSLIRRKPLIRQGAPRPSPSSEFGFQFPQGSVGSSAVPAPRVPLSRFPRQSSDGEEDAVDEGFWARRAAGDVDIHRDGGIDAAEGSVIRAENAAADAACADGHNHLGVRGGGVGLL